MISLFFASTPYPCFYPGNRRVKGNFALSGVRSSDWRRWPFLPNGHFTDRKGGCTQFHGRESFTHGRRSAPSEESPYRSANHAESPPTSQSDTGEIASNRFIQSHRVHSRVALDIEHLSDGAMPDT
jgi:hypothetical protein